MKKHCWFVQISAIPHQQGTKRAVQCRVNRRAWKKNVLRERNGVKITL